jgi:hypothetical protein
MRALQSRANALAHRSEDQPLSSALQKLALELSSQVQHFTVENFIGRFPSKAFTWAVV